MEDEDRYTRITLRIPKNVHVRLQEAADKNSHSMNAEIISRLQQSFLQPQEASLWERSFPSAAASHRSGEMTRQVGREQLLLRELQRNQLEARHEALISQVLSLESQAMALHHLIMQLDNEIERADLAGEPGKVSLALKQVKVSRERLVEIDDRISATKALIEACAKEKEAK